MNETSAPVCWICGTRPALANGLTVDSSICATCRDLTTRPYDEAWQVLALYLHARWHEILARGCFDLSPVFGKAVARQALDVHLHFVKILGCRLKDEGVDVDLKSFAAALQEHTPHPEVLLMVASSRVAPGKLLSYRSEVSVLRDGSEVQSALWMNLVHPIAIKICYLKAGAPLRAPDGFPWHPTRQRKIVKISPYPGDIEPLIARRDLRI